MRNSRPILLIEDDRLDTITIKRAFKELNITNQLVHTLNGEEALEYLRNADNEKPCVILLDLNMPKMGGIEFLKIVKDDGELKKIPVIVLTTSKEKQDILGSFEHGAAGYVVKPADYKEFVNTINAINLYWTSSELPEQKRRA